MTMASASAQTTVYLNSAQATANVALSNANSWWEDAAGTTANTTAVGASGFVLAFNNLVPGAYGQRTGGGSGGTWSNINGFQVLDPGGAITVTTASNAGQTVTINGGGIDLSAATQDFTYMAGSAVNPTYTAYLRLGATQTWKVQEGRTLTIGSTTWNTNDVPNTNVNATANGRILNIAGNGATALGTVVFNANLQSALNLTIDGTGSGNSGGNVYFNGTSNNLTSLAITNATTTFASGGTTTGTVTVNSGGALVNNGIFSGAATIASGGALGGTGTFSGAVTVSGNLNPGSSPGTLTFDNGLTLDDASVTMMEIGGTAIADIDLVNVAAGTLTLGGMLNIVSYDGFDGTTAGDYNLFDFTALSGNFSSVTAFGTALIYDDVSAWTSELYRFDIDSGVLSVIPEPSAALLGGLGLLGLLRRRRAA